VKNNFFTIGDSWVSGDSKHSVDYFTKTGLEKFSDFHQTHPEYLRQFRRWSFPKYLSDHFNMNNINLGAGGSTNMDILYKLGMVIDSTTDEDFILVCFTTPFRLTRGVTKTTLDAQYIVDNYYHNYVLKAVSMLDGKRYLLTHAFTPIVGYFNTDSYDHIEHFIEWDKKNNSLLDIVTDMWVDESKTSWGNNWPTSYKFKGVMSPLNKILYAFPTTWEMKVKFNSEFEAEEKVWKYHPNVASCLHPSISGHKVIAKTLIPYIERRMG
jgi:hypothetical protein